MKIVTVCVWAFLMLAAGSLTPAFSQTPEGLLESPSLLSAWFVAQAGGAAARSGDEETLYERGTQALDQRSWDRAQQLFDDVIKLKGHRTDGALYWKAYAQNKQGQRPEALATPAAFNFCVLTAC